jgi:DNA-directed RNA polymerase specialized sigma24 family protein
VSAAPNEVTSTTATDASGRHGGVAFTTTHWSVVLEAQGESPAAQEALGKLCCTYWRPIFAFLRRQGLRPDEAEDITQGFFAELLERRSLDAVRKEKGRLRSFLLGGVKYFLANEQRRAMAIKRGKGQRLIPLEELRAEDRIDIEPADPMTAEMIYERRWALTLLERVLNTGGRYCAEPQGPTPTPTPTATATATSTPTAPPTPTATSTPSPTQRVTPTPRSRPSPTARPTPPPHTTPVSPPPSPRPTPWPRPSP